ncbi:hypothetical protein DH2020_003244 [Rehmannia glutinosa]|uniref:Pectinesterase n=1 Tax=Rehmannia glutinosa TaxID=99300 RepID=A0ABR0XL77_REHGL
MAGNPKRKTAIVTVCSLLLVAMVVALISTGRNNENDGEDFAFHAAIRDIKEAAKNSTLLAKLEKDPRAKSALETCQELADRAVSDLQRSVEKFNDFDITEVDNFLSDLKIWLSGAITYQETCLNGFEGVEGDAGEKMRAYLTKGMQMTSNGLAMVDEISSVLAPIGGDTFNTRRLLSDQILGHDDELPDWIDFDRRGLLTSNEIKPDIVVAKDGSGNFTTINDALDKVPKNKDSMFVLYIKEGVYEEKVQIGSSLTHLVMIGDGPTKTRITGRLNYIDGTNTYQTATVAVQGDHFTAKDIGFENSAGAEKHQAVALRVSADLSVFYNCQMDGYQDTLYAHTYRQFYRDCVISGTIDFIFGDSAAVFQGCTIVVRKPLSNQNCIVTAQGRKDMRQPTGIVLQNCSIVSDPEYYPVRYTNKAYLGRPWKEFSRTIIMESFLDDLIQPEGWLPWNETYALDTLFYTEFNNRGPAASKTDRVKWAGVKELPASRIKRFTADQFIHGKKWIKSNHIPYVGGFIFPVPEEDPNVEYSPVVPEEDKDLGEFRDKSEYVSKGSPKADKKDNGPDAPTASPSSIAGAPVSQIAAAPWMEPYGVAQAPSPVSVPQPKEGGLKSDIAHL